MDKMKSLILESLKRRLDAEISSQNPVKFLKKIPTATILDIATPLIYLYTRKKYKDEEPIFFTELISAIGHSIRKEFNLQQDSALAAKTGAFIIYTFEENEILKVKLSQGKQKHATYVIEVLNDDVIINLWESVPIVKTEKLPSEFPYKPWNNYLHSETKTKIIKTGNSNVLKSFTKTNYPLCYESLNRSMKVEWKVNVKIFELVNWALKYKTDAFSDIWEQQDSEARNSKLREAKSVYSIAKRFTYRTFYHLYYYDFRGRKYPATAYFHEQGSDLAKGLLFKAKGKSIQKEGLFWLAVTLANNWAGDSGREDKRKTDKISIKDRAQWTFDNEEILLNYALNPKVNQGWMYADQPWQFLAGCFELLAFRNYQNINGKDDYNYETFLVLFIDGSNNGSQHLAALTRDETAAPYVNLIPSEFPGDLYAFVGENTWESIQRTLEIYAKNELLEYNVIIDTIIKIKDEIKNALNNEIKNELIKKLLKYKALNKDKMMKVAPLFWNRITDKKHIRKIVKRNIMTIPYGGTPYGLGSQQIKDAKKHNIALLSYLENKWGAYLGRLVFETCNKKLEKSMNLLRVFEMAGNKAESEGLFLSWTVPVTKFPVVQNYVEGEIKKVYVQYGPPKGNKLSTGYYENTFQLNICFIETHKPSKGKQAQGATPNIIHSLDAAHLTLTVCKAPFDVITIHDSYGCLPCDMPELFKLVRETFVELYQGEPLFELLKEIKIDVNEVKYGTLKVEDILESDFAFC
jgi:DNA-directed RNA polymerase